MKCHKSPSGVQEGSGFVHFWIRHVTSYLCVLPQHMARWRPFGALPQDPVLPVCDCSGVAALGLAQKWNDKYRTDQWLNVRMNK